MTIIEDSKELWQTTFELMAEKGYNEIKRVLRFKHVLIIEFGKFPEESKVGT